MKKRVALLLCVFLLSLLTACTKPAQSVTAGNVRTVFIPGFTDTVDAAQLSIGDSGLEVCRIGTYTGTFVEQGTDTECKNIPAIIVCNTSDQIIEKAALVRGSQTFIVTMLPPDGICLVQEQTGQPELEYNLYSLVFREDVHVLADTSSADRVQIEAEKGQITIHNISGEDIPGSVNVWYKTKRNGLYIGGVSYKASVDDGILFAESTATVQTAHYDPTSSELIAVTFSE